MTDPINFLHFLNKVTRRILRVMQCRYSFFFNFSINRLPCFKKKTWRSYPSSPLVRLSLVLHRATLLVHPPSFVDVFLDYIIYSGHVSCHGMCHILSHQMDEKGYLTFTNSIHLFGFLLRCLIFFFGPP